MDRNTNSGNMSASGDDVKEPTLWKIAQRRASFKYNVLIYFIMSIFFWTLWYINLRQGVRIPDEENLVPWPVWPMLGWGIGLFFHYLHAYRSKNTLAEKEYQKLKRNTNN